MAIGLSTENEMNRAMLYENVNEFDIWTAKKNFKVPVDLLIKREDVALQYRGQILIYTGERDERGNVYEVVDCGVQDYARVILYMIYV